MAHITIFILSFNTFYLYQFYPNTSRRSLGRFVLCVSVHEWSGVLEKWNHRASLPGDRWQRSAVLAVFLVSLRTPEGGKVKEHTQLHLHDNFRISTMLRVCMGYSQSFPECCTENRCCSKHSGMPFDATKTPLTNYEPFAQSNKPKRTFWNKKNLQTTP